MLLQFEHVKLLFEECREMKDPGGHRGLKAKLKPLLLYDKVGEVALRLTLIFEKTDVEFDRSKRGGTKQPRAATSVWLHDNVSDDGQKETGIMLEGCKSKEKLQSTTCMRG